MLLTLRKYTRIIETYKITRFEQIGASLRVQAQVTLQDGSNLHIRETVISGTKRKYSYHWQDSDGNLLVRWDNAPDWDVETFPHHKHMGSQKNVIPSYERTLEQVLAVIEKELTAG